MTRKTQMQTTRNSLQPLSFIPLSAFSAVLILSSGCSRSDSERHRFRIYEEDGVTIAETTGGPKYSEPLFEYEEVLRLKQDETREESLLGQPFQYLMDENGIFYVSDTRPPRIACFDADGNYSHDIGRQGEGPGEYQFPQLLSAEEGIVTVFDFRLRRTSFFRTDGTFVESIALPQGRIRPNLLYRGPGDERILIGQEEEGGINAESYFSAVAIVLSANGDTLAILSTEKVKRGFFFFLEEYRTGGNAFVHYNAWPVAMYHHSLGILLTCGIEPRMRLYGLDGQLNREIQLDIPPEPLTDEEKQVVMSTYRQRIADADDGRSKALAKRYLELVEFCDPKAYWFSALPDDYGYIWAMHAKNLFAYPPDSPPTSSFRVFSPEGEYLGDTKWIVSEATVSRGHLLTIQEDEETGELNLIVHRIRPAVEGLEYP